MPPIAAKLQILASVLLVDLAKAFLPRLFRQSSNNGEISAGSPFPTLGEPAPRKLPFKTPEIPF